MASAKEVSLQESVLTALQKRFLAVLPQSFLCEHFYFTGGTALSAYYLGHRLSEDLDFFSEQEVPLSSIVAFLETLPQQKRYALDRKFDRRIFMIHFENNASLKVEFSYFPFKRLEGGNQFQGITVDSFLDIAVNKIFSITERTEPKDYADLYLILREGNFTIQHLMGKAQEKFGLEGISYLIQGALLREVDYSAVSFLKPFDPQDAVQFFREVSRTLIGESLLP